MMLIETFHDNAPRRPKNRRLPLCLLLVALVHTCTAAAGTFTRPPAGWNAWFAFDRDVTEAGVLNNARALVRTGLAAKGPIEVLLVLCLSGGGR